MSKKLYFHVLVALFCATALLACNSQQDEKNPTPVAATTEPVVVEHIPTLTDYIRIQLESNSQTKLYCGESLICRNKNLASIYESLNYAPIWLNDKGELSSSVDSVIEILRNSYQDGLYTPNYHLIELENDMQLLKLNTLDKNPQVYIDFDLTLSDAYLSYAKDMQNGRINPVSTYPDWGVDRTLINVRTQFESAIHNGELLNNLQNMTPTNSQYQRLKNKLAAYNDLLAESGENVISAADRKNMNLIALNMDRLRWLPHVLAESYALVNIPRFELDLFVDNGESIALSMPVIVGKGGENKTCLVSSQINSVEFNPYWGIPKRIATDEYLVKLQKDPNYLANKNIRIFSKNNKEVDPLTIGWESVNAENFKYFFRQDPGVKNALGKVKFVFPNSCGIYMHDTSNRGLFGRDARSMSHGCVRIGKPIQLANYLLVDRDNNSEARISKMIESDVHAGVRIKQPLPLYITYQTTVVDGSGELRLYKDIYGVDSVKLPLYFPAN